MEVTRKEVDQLIEIEKPDTLWSHISGLFSRTKVSGNRSSKEIRIWQQSQWTQILYAVFIFKLNSKQQLIAIETQLNVMGKVLFFVIFSVLLYVFIPKDAATYLQDKFWVYTIIKIIFLLLYLICGKVMYDHEKEIQKETFFYTLGIKIDDEKEINERSFFSFFIRFFSYSIGLVTLYTSIFHFIPSHQYEHAIFGIVVVCIYFITDILLLFKHKKKKTKL